MFSEIYIYEYEYMHPIVKLHFVFHSLLDILRQFLSTTRSGLVLKNVCH